MTASLNAASNSSHLVSNGDPREVNRGDSSGGGESFSQVLRRTSGEGRASGAHRSREVEKREGKPEKKDDDANTTASSATNGTASVVEKSALPITFLFGLPTEQLQNLDEQAATGSSSFQVGEKTGRPNGPVQAGSGTFSPDGDRSLVMTATLDLPELVLAGNTAPSKTVDSPGTLSNSELLGITSRGDVAKSAAGALRTDSLAFAMRLGNGEPAAAPKAESSVGAEASPANNNGPSILGASMPAAIHAVSGSTLEENTHQHDPSAQEQNIVDLSAAQASERFDLSKISEENATATAPAAPVPPDPPATAEPVRNVHMQLVSDDNRRVDVRLIDRGGELHVSVKSVDTALTQKLQDHLPDLTARLEAQHMQAELWVPKAAEPAKAEGGNTNGSLSDPNTRFDQGNGENRKDGRQQGRPDWVDALENYT